MNDITIKDLLSIILSVCFVLIASQFINSGIAALICFALAAIIVIAVFLKDAIVAWARSDTGPYVPPAERRRIAREQRQRPYDLKKDGGYKLGCMIRGIASKHSP